MFASEVNDELYVTSLSLANFHIRARLLIGHMIDHARTPFLSLF